MPTEPPRLGLVRELGARLGQTLLKLDRLILHVDVATRPLGDVKHSIQAYWSTFNDRPEQWGSGLLDWERRLLEHTVAPGERLLLVGCGSGRELEAMLERGCAVVGVEPALDTLEIARQTLSAASESGQLTLLHGFVEDVGVPGEFDVCWFSYFSYSYIPDRRRRVTMLERLAANHLRPSGRIVVTCHCQMHPPKSGAVAVGRLAGRLWRNDWELVDGDELVRAQPAFRVFHYQHVFTPEELAAEAAEAGLVITESHLPEAVVLQTPAASATLSSSSPSANPASVIRKAQ